MVSVMDILKKVGATEIALLTIMSYVIGFIITNIYLSNFGFSEFSFFHIKFIPVGLLFILLTSLIHFSIYYVDAVYKDRAWYIRIPLFAVLLVFIIYCLGIVFSSSTDSLAGYTYGPRLRFDFTVWIVINAVLFFIVTSVSHDDFLLKGFKDIEKGAKATYKILVFLVLMIFNVGLFANLIYPSVPTYLGGGQKIQAAITLEDSEEKEGRYGKIIYQTPQYVLYETMASSTDRLKVTLIPFDKIKSIDYLGIDKGTGYEIFSKYKARMEDFTAQ